MSEINTRGAILEGEAPGGDPGLDIRGAEQVQVEKPGFFTSVQRGWEQAKGGMAALRAAGQSDMLGKLEQLEREGDSPAVQQMAKDDLLFANHYNRWKLSKGDPKVLQELKQGELSGVAQNMGKVEQSAAESQLLPQSPAMEKFQQSKTTGEALGNLGSAPLDIGSQIVGESFGSQGLGLPLTVGAGILAGPAGLAAGSGASSFVAEAGGGTLELLTKLGIDLNDTAAVAKALNSPEFKAAQAEKMKKAAIIGTVDAATAGMAGVSLAKKPLANIAAQTGLQMAGGAGGEIAGSLAIGEEVQPAAWISEAVGEVSGGVQDVTTLAARKILTAKGLNHAAKEMEREVLTGLDTEQQETVDQVVKTAPKPRFNAIQARVFSQANMAGVDPIAALAIMDIESKGDPNAKNPNSTAHGLFQQLDSNWNASGGGDRSDLDTQIINGIASLGQTAAAMEKELGRKPDSDELYFGHLFGPKGGAVALQASVQDPQGSFLETVKKWDKTHADAIVKNNGLAGMTNEQAANKVFGMVGKAKMKLGLNDQLNARTNARGDLPPVADVTGEEHDAIEAGLEDLDAMFQELDEVELTDQLIAEAEAEESLEKAAVDPVAAVEAQALNGEAVATEEPEIVGELRATDTEIREGNAQLAKDAYVQAGKAPEVVENLIARHQAKANDLDETMVLWRGPKGNFTLVAATIPDPFKDAERIATFFPQGKELKRAESWVSIDENRNRRNYDNPNDAYAGKVHKAPIVAGAEGFEGLTLEDRPLKAGEVIAVGVDSAHTPLPVMQATQSALQEVIQRYAPTARVALTFQTEADDVVSSMHEPEGRKGYGKKNKPAAGSGLYRINMRNLTNFGVTDSGSKSTDAQRKFTYGMYHEAGHVIASEQMMAGMSPRLRQKFANLGRDEYFDQTDMAELDPQRAAVLQEYNDLKWKVLNDPSFTGEQFAYAWFSPWKLSHALSTANTPGIFQFAKKFLGETTAQALKGPAVLLAEAVEARVRDVLTPHEYMAEQFARYAYTNKLAEHSSIGTFEFFRQALERMRMFFQQLKRGKEIKPGIAFAEWVDSLTDTAKFLDDNAALPPLPEVQQPKRQAKPRVKLQRKETLADKPSILPPSPVKPEVVAKAVSREYSAAQNEALLLLASKGLRELAKEDPKKYDHWMQLVRNDRLDDLKTDLALYIDDDFVREKVRFDRDIPVDEGWREIELGLEQVVPAKSGMKRWLPAGLRRLANLQWYTWTSRQLAAKYVDVAGVQVIDRLHTDYKAYKARLELPGVEAVQRWSKLGKEQDGLLQQAMREEHAAGEHFAELTKVNKTWRFIPSEKLARYAEAKGLDPETVEVWLDVKNAHMQHMIALKNGLLKKAADRLKGKPKSLQKKAAELNQLFDVIRSTPFIPQTRFGEFAIHVKEDTLDGPKIVHVEFFETAIARDEAMEKLKKAAGPERKVTAANYNTTSAILRTLPPQLLGTWAEELNLTDMEKAELKQIADALTMNPQLRKYSTQLAGITGANKELKRNFAEFMWHNSGNIAKVHYAEHFKKGLLLIEAEKQAAGAEGNVAYHDELTKLVDFYKHRIGHILNPTDEWQAVRTFVVVKQLWFKISTAIANLTAIKDVWATAAAQQGLLRGTVSTGDAAWKALADSMTKVYQRVMRQPVEGSQVFAEDTRWALDQAYKDGLISETFAAQLGTIANTGVLGRLGMHEADSIFRKAVWAGMLPQHVIETYVRRVSLVAQFEHYQRQGMKKEQAYLAARKDTYLTQGDNTLSNRPRMALGKAANFLIYFGYLQNQWYLLSGAKERSRNYAEAIDAGLTANLTREQARSKFYRTKFGGETMKTWMAYAFLGGAMGMPGAEDLDNVMELIAKKFFGTHFSLKEYAYKLAAEISENAASIGLDVNPRTLVHGNMSDMDFFGLTPSVDLSPSAGLGNAIPGLGGLGDAGNRNQNLIIGAMGPLGGVLKQFNDIFSDDPSMLKKFGFFMPNVTIGIGKAIHEHERGVKAPNGGRITIDRQTGEVRDLTTGETLTRLMGFTPEIIAANREIHWMQQEQQTYWTTRRNNLVTQIFEARMQGDREAIADANEALKEFNEGAPPKLRITGKELRKAIIRKRKAARNQEAGIGRLKKFRSMDRDIREDVMGQPEED